MCPRRPGHRLRENAIALGTRLQKQRYSHVTVECFIIFKLSTLCLIFFFFCFASEFVINSVNEDFDRRTEPILNEILENLRTLQCDENNVYYTRLVQYVILVNYIGDPTAPECLQKTSGKREPLTQKFPTRVSRHPRVPRD
uniref:Uncharacterized protein n=1 Tax=Sipha flava TaxID=143950 RepID=A0A2S2QKK0_9HEMI